MISAPHSISNTSASSSQSSRDDAQITSERIVASPITKPKSFLTNSMITLNPKKSPQTVRSSLLRFRRSSVDEKGLPLTSLLTSSDTSCSLLENDDDQRLYDQIRQLSIKEKSLRSCMKLSYVTRNKKKASVRFTSVFKNRIDVRVHNVESLMEYWNDLWWSKSDIENFTAKQTINKISTNLSENYNKKTFLDAYQYMRVQFYSCLDSDLEQSLQSLSIQYPRIVQGYSRVYGGLEKLIGFDCYQRDERTRYIIKSIIRYSKKHPHNVGLLRAHSEELTEESFNSYAFMKQSLYRNCEAV